MAEHQATALREEQTNRHRPAKWQSKCQGLKGSPSKGDRELWGVLDSSGGYVAAFVKTHRRHPQESEFYCVPAYASANLI